MCEAASMVLTKDNVLIGVGTNSHREILKQHGIQDVKLMPNFVKVEITPPEVDKIPNYSAPFNEWVYRVDQDYLPDWYIPKLDERRVRKALSKWYHEHIELMNTDSPYVTFVGGVGSTLKGGERSNLQGGDYSTLIGGAYSTLLGGNMSTLTGGWGSNLTGGVGSTITGLGYSNLIGGACSKLTGGDGSTLSGGDGSTLFGGCLFTYSWRY